jgi:hypothetical protein
MNNNTLYEYQKVNEKLDAALAIKNTCEQNFDPVNF